MSQTSSSQEKYKRRGHNWRESRQDEAAIKCKNDRYMHLIQHFRKIDLQDIDMNDGSDNDDEEVLRLIQNQSYFENDDDWDNPKPQIDLRAFNFSLPGILCPFCRNNLMSQDASGLLTCCCSSTLKTQTPITSIKEMIQGVVVAHAACPSNQSPDYTMFKSRIVLTCSHCDLIQVVS